MLPSNGNFITTPTIAIYDIHIDFSKSSEGTTAPSSFENVWNKFRRKSPHQTYTSGPFFITYLLTMNQVSPFYNKFDHNLSNIMISEVYNNNCNWLVITSFIKPSLGLQHITDEMSYCKTRQFQKFLRAVQIP